MSKNLNKDTKKIFYGLLEEQLRGAVLVIPFNVIDAEDSFESISMSLDVSSTKGDVTIDKLDQGNGSVVFSGDLSSVESALERVEQVLSNVMHFAVCPITRT